MMKYDDSPSPFSGNLPAATSDAATSALCRLLTVADAVARARAAVAQGKMPGLSWLFDELRLICLDAATMTHADTLDLQQALSSLRQDLDNLAKDMTKDMERRFSPVFYTSETRESHPGGAPYVLSPSAPPTTDKKV